MAHPYSCRRIPGRVAILAVATILSAGFAFGDDVTCTWKGVSGNWSNSENWTGGVPTSADIASFPKSSAGYTVTVDCEAVCKYLRHENGSGSGKVTFTGSGSGTLTCSGNAAGPSVSGYLSSNTKVAFANITANLGGFNPWNGNLIIEDGANIRVGTLYMNGGSSTLTVNGGDLYVNSVSIRTECSLIFNGGTTSLPNVDCRYNNVDRAVAYKLHGGKVLLRGVPLNYTNAIIDFTGGELHWTTASFSPIDSSAWLPKSGGTLVLKNGTYTALSTDPYYDSTVPLDGAIYITNDVDRCTSDNTTTTPGVYAYTNTTFTGSGELYANFMFVRGTCTVDIAKLSLGHRMHFARDSSVMLVPNGTTFGAYRDWTSVYNNAYSYLFGPITVDTADCFDHVTPRCITFGRTVLDGDVTYRVTGTGTNRLWLGATPTRIASLSVDPGATFDLKGYFNNNSAGRLVADRLIASAGATLVTDAKWSDISADDASIDPTAKILVNIPSDITAGRFYPVLTDAITNNTDKSYLEQVELIGEGAAGWTAKSLAGAIYLTDGNPTAHDYGTSGQPYGWGWTGLSGGNFSDGGNWSGETGLTSSTANSVENSSARTLFFGRAAQNVVTNDISDSSYDNGVAVCTMRFLSSAGPYEVYGNTITLYSQAFSNEHSPIVSQSAFPVVIYAPVRRTSGTFSIQSIGGSSLQLMGEVKSTAAYLFEKGDVRFGGNANFSGLYFGSANANNPDRVTVLDGGKVYISSYNYALRAASYAGESATVKVRRGGVFACGGIWAEGDKTKVSMDVDGYFAISNTLYSMKNVPFSGTGTAYLGGVAPSNATVEAQFSGNLTLAMGGDWQVVSARCPNTPFTLAVKSGNLSLAPAANWSYGVPDGVSTTTDASNRAISVAEGATLTFAASAFTTVLRDPILAEGVVAFEEGAKLAFGGDLLAAMRPRGGGWTTFATASSFTGSPALPGQRVFDLRIVDNGDGTVSMQSRIRSGIVVNFR